MALIKEFETPQYAIGSYWKVSGICIDKNFEIANFALYLYKSKEVSDKDPIAYMYCWGVNELMSMDDKTLFNKYFRDKGQIYKDIDTACYMYAKEHVEFFKDAVDDDDEIALLRD